MPHVPQLSMRGDFTAVVQCMFFKKSFGRTGSQSGREGGRGEGGPVSRMLCCVTDHMMQSTHAETGKKERGSSVVVFLCMLCNRDLF